MIINLGFKPNPKQELMLTDTTHRYICYGGAKGGGKTWALRVKAILLAANYDGIKILVIRRTYPELRNNHIQPMMAMLRGISKYTETDHTFRFPNGSTIEYGYCATYSDVVRYQGHEYDILMIDEATTITEEVSERAKTLRPRHKWAAKTSVSNVCNPGGVGHEWVKRLFIDRDYRDGENPDDYVFIRLRSTTIRYSCRLCRTTLSNLSHFLRTGEQRCLKAIGTHTRADSFRSSSRLPRCGAFRDTVALA